MDTRDTSLRSSPENAEGRQRLQSWKEIAAYLQVSDRSARRWEKTEGLPIHRHLHQKRDSVYAEPAELDAWWSNRGPRLAEQQRVQTLRQRHRARWAALAVLAVVAAAVYFAWQRQQALVSTAKPINSLAVLPMENQSGDPAQDYFADGMTDALITELGKISTLKVISRTSAMQYKGVKKPLPQVARELHVEAVVEGAVAREGNHVRVNVQLLHGPSDRHLWAGSYQRETSSILALQSEVARAIAREIQVKVSPQEQARLAVARPVNPAAHEAYLRGRYYLEKWSADGIRQAQEYFQQAVTEDPNYALAYVGLAEAYRSLSNPYGIGIVPELSREEGEARERAATMKALELDETLGEAHVSLANIKFEQEWDFAAADQEFKRAIKLNPNYSQAYHWYSHYLMPMGRVHESLLASKRWVELDPLSPAASLHLGWHYLAARQYDQAVEQYRKTLQMDPNYIEAHRQLGQALLGKRMYDEAIRELQKAAELSDNRTFHLASLGEAYAVAGRRAEAQKILRELQDRAKRSYVHSYFFAILYARLGQRQRTLEFLQKAYHHHEPELVHLKLEPAFDSLNSDPRFQDLLRRMNFPQ